MGLFQRRPRGAQPEPRQPESRTASMSPSEMYEAGGGDLGSANPFLQELMRLADDSHNKQRTSRAGRMERVEIPKPRKLDRTKPATLGQYLAWLDGFIKRGGTPTHFYDYPFDRAGFVYALSDVMVDSDAEYGSQCRQIVVPAGRRVDRTDPTAYFYGWGHTNLFLMDGFDVIGGVVPVYSNPEFEAVLTEECREERDRQAALSRAFRARGNTRRQRPNRRQSGGHDEALLRTLGGATFGPNASLTLPSGLTLGADEAQVFTSLYNDEEQR